MTEVMKYSDVRWSLGSGSGVRGSLTKTKMFYKKGAKKTIPVAKMYSMFFPSAWLFN